MCHGPGVTAVPGASDEEMTTKHRQGLYFHRGCLIALVVAYHSTGDFISESADMVNPATGVIGVLPDCCATCSEKFSSIQSDITEIFDKAWK